MATWMGYERRKPLLERAWLSAGTLARFAAGLTWSEILAIDTRVRDLWWSHAVGNAEDAGLLAWDRARGLWMLTEQGRDHVRCVS